MAITGALAAVIVPVAIDQIENAHVAKAKQDVNGISAAISLFHKDTGVWPVRKDSSTPTGVTILRSGNANANFTAFGPVTDGNVKDPTLADESMVWNSGASDAQAMVNHLTIDNPGGSTSTPNGGYIAADVNWNGPYMPQVYNDPWGRNYLVYSKAFYARENTADKDIYVWVISGGPNETLETDVTSPILNNVEATGLSSTLDDIGVMMFRARAGVEGLPGGS